MSDLVKRLRMDVEPSEGDMEAAADLIETQATRITELEAALQKIVDRTHRAHPMSYVGDYCSIAQAALAGGRDNGTL